MNDKETDKVYVLGRNDPMFGDIVFYTENSSFWNGEATRPIDATKYEFDDALKRARALREFGLHYRVILLSSLMQ